VTTKIKLESFRKKPKIIIRNEREFMKKMRDKLFKNGSKYEIENLKKKNKKSSRIIIKKMKSKFLYNRPEYIR